MSVLTTSEAKAVSFAARRVGGYDELIRLDRKIRDLEHLGLGYTLTRDDTGRYDIVAAEPLPKDSVAGTALDLEPEEVIKAGQNLIPRSSIIRVDISKVEEQIVTVHTAEGAFVAEGFDAIEIVMLLKASALEGRRLRWPRGAWAWHNCIAHPYLQLCVWLGFKRAGIAYHDRTTPRPR